MCLGREPASCASCASAAAPGRACGRARPRPLRLDLVDVDGTPTGVYVEHFTRRSTFRRLRIGPSVRVGLLTEWASLLQAACPRASTT